MNRRTVAGLLALGLIAVLSLVASRLPTGYVTFRPGPTMNVLGDYGDKPIIKIDGHRSYVDDGALRMTTVYPSGPDTHVSIANVIRGWLSPVMSVLPRDAVYVKGETQESVRKESAAQMTSSQDSATAAALTVLGEPFTSEVKVGEVADDGASAGKLRPGDVFVKVGDVVIDSPETLLAHVRPLAPGSELPITVRRDGKNVTVVVTTRAAPDNKNESRIGVLIAQGFDFPFTVKIQLPETVGGPSAGLMFALGIYDMLTPGSMTDGKPIAGTGTVDAAGTVGAIGGIAQKIAGAQRDGARLFLAPAANCTEVAEAHYDRDKIKVIRVNKLDDAIKDVEAWAGDPNADLPRCEG